MEVDDFYRVYKKHNYGFLVLSEEHQNEIKDTLKQFEFLPKGPSEDISTLYEDDGNLMVNNRDWLLDSWSDALYLAAGYSDEIEELRPIMLLLEEMDRYEDELRIKKYKKKIKKLKKKVYDLKNQSINR